MIHDAGHELRPEQRRPGAGGLVPSALLQLGILVLAVFGVLALAWAVTREWARPPGSPGAGRGAVQAEPCGARYCGSASASLDLDGLL